MYASAFYHTLTSKNPIAGMKALHDRLYGSPMQSVYHNEPDELKEERTLEELKADLSALEETYDKLRRGKEARKMKRRITGPLNNCQV